MKRLALLIIGLAALFPISGLAATECANFNCACSWQGDFISNIPDVSTNEACTDTCTSSLSGVVAIDIDPADVSAVLWCLDAGGAGEIISNPASAAAATPIKDPILPCLNVPIPGLGFGNCDPDGNQKSDVSKFIVFDEATGYQKNNLLGHYVEAVYQYLIIAASIVAVTMLMIAGLQYATARGESKQVEQAKKRINNAIVGVILLLLAYNIAFIINPDTTTFESLSLKVVKTIPLENQFSPIGNQAGACLSDPKALYGRNDFQDCALKEYGDTESSIKLVDIKYKNRTYKVNEKAADAFQAAFDAVDAYGKYDITTDLSGGTFNWRCNKNGGQYLSPHSFGIAIDINPGENPNCPKACQDGNETTTCSCVAEPACVQQCASASYAIPQEVIKAFTDNGFSWGGEWQGVKDYMHFTYNGECLE